MSSQFDELAALYNNMAEWPFRKYCEIPSVLSVLGDVSNLALFDFGCGNGLYSRILKQHGAKRVVGYDQSIGMYDYARRREEKEKLGIEYTSSIMPHHRHSFDVVISVYVLPYAPSLHALDSMCAEMTSLLKPGGRLITLPIHPDFCPTPSFYEEYGFRLIPTETEGSQDASIVTLDLCHPPYDIQVQAYYWSASSLEASLRKASATTIRWHEHHITTSGMEILGEAFWKNYISYPHAAIIDCTIDSK